MRERERQPEWGGYQDRARQPIGPDGFNRKNGIGRRARAGGRQVTARGRAGDPYNRDPRSAGGQGGDGGRSRLVAVLVLMVAAVIVIIGGIAATTGDAGSAAGVSISILPFPQETNTSVTQ